ncbi:hypothetical protein A5714_20290 [Mycobacterium sp. E2462]|uniref:PPE family protein, SVP subgroup n=1 Tax=Mycobacterium sp. E2462 TaxID=1834133 RepID=UPI0007FCFB8B|nr:PPE domain-containing protein [Mycobacterium sp. E2462]OBI09119.1 hypothetical protein A5714_20290 [Mycobacterium sp. E2462]
MDFATLPPEVNSGLMYAGPGLGPMLAASEAWDTLAAELYSAANSYAAVVTGLTSGAWLGPSAVSMTAAASSYVAWLSRTAGQAEETAGQARVAAGAYEAAFAATVPPEEVAANRTQLATLVATNVLGQNTAAIAATEAEYGEMWAQDAVAMYGYSATAASATQMTPFTSPQQNTNAGGVGAQQSAITQAGATSAGQVQSAVSNAAVQPASNATSLGGLFNSDVFDGLTPLDLLDLGADAVAFGIDAPISPLAVISLPIDLVGAQTGLHTDDIISGWADAGVTPKMAADVPGPVPASAPSVAQSMTTAGVGEANSVGALSVPPTWTAATPAVRPIALTLPAFSLGEQAAAAAPSTGVGELALSSLAGRTVADTFRQRERVPAAAAAPAKDAAPAPEGDEDSGARTVVTGIAAEIRDMGRLRDEGLITDEEFLEQKNRLLGR